MNDDTETSSARRTRSVSKIGSLPPGQRELVDRWLFQENATYEQVVQRCRDLFHLKLTGTSVHRYRHHCERERELQSMSGARPSGDGASDPATLTPQERYGRVLDGLEIKAMTLASRPLSKSQSREFCEMIRVLVSARREANEASRLALIRQKAQYDVAAACLEHKFEFDKIAEDPKFDVRQQIQAVREELFGPDLPE